MARKRISPTKRIHEAHRYLRIMEQRISLYANTIARADRMTTRFLPDGTGEVFMPAADIFERVNPTTSPLGLVFKDGAFLVFKEIFRFDYPPDADHPTILRREYSFHYQRPQQRFFLRFHNLLWHGQTPSVAWANAFCGMGKRLLWHGQTPSVAWASCPLNYRRDAPGVGDPLTHPLHHLHVGIWLADTDPLPAVPPLRAIEMSLGEMLDTARVNYFLPPAVAYKT